MSRDRIINDSRIRPELSRASRGIDEGVFDDNDRDKPLVKPKKLHPPCYPARGPSTLLRHATEARLNETQIIQYIPRALGDPIRLV